MYQLSVHHTEDLHQEETSHLIMPEKKHLYSNDCRLKKQYRDPLAILDKMRDDHL